MSAIEDATRILRRLTDDLVDTVGMESGQLSVNRTSTDLVTLAQDAVRVAQETAGTHQLVLLGPTRLDGEWDRDRVRQLLRNLISNAIKYSPSGGEIRVVLASGADQALIEIADQGLGIPPERMQRLFQPYSRLHREQQIEGLGLGLYLCKVIAEAHGGRIWAESEPGVGSTFHVVLPLAASERRIPVVTEKRSDPSAAHG